MNGNSERGRDGEETNDKLRRERVAERAAARRERLGYDLDSPAEWDSPPGAWYEAGEVTPSAVSAAAEGAGGMWRFDVETFTSRSVGISYSSGDVWLAVDAGEGEVRVGAGGELSGTEARELGAILFATAEGGNIAEREGVFPAFTPGSASVSGEAPAVNWTVEGVDADTTLSVALDDGEIRLAVEAVAPKAKARLVVEFSREQAAEFAAAIYQAGEDTEALAELDDADTDTDTDAAKGGA